MARQQDPFVVGIGASAGGLQVIQSLFDSLPQDAGITFVIIQHLSPDFKSLMPELLAKHTSMPIFTAEDGQKLEPDTVYLNQRSKNLEIEGDRFKLSDKRPREILNLPVDLFFHSLGFQYKERCAVVVLSGTGSDGSRGIRSVKEYGGTVIVQDPTTAQFDGMPNFSIGTDLADFILPPQEISKTILKCRDGLKLSQQIVREGVAPEGGSFQKILESLHEFSGIDFGQYREKTIARSLHKRLVANGYQDLESYLDFINREESEKEALTHAILIGVTGFFRDPAAFDSLKEIFLPNVLQKRERDKPVRIWIPGCSTGEEAYSVAMLVDEYIRENNLTVGYKIFATDVDPRALRKASLGIYPVTISQEVGRTYFETYFVKKGDQLQVTQALRERIVFSAHNLLSDPPMIRMDLICCRNLLIYIASKAQNAVLARFQYALNVDGFLFLGSSESLGPMRKFFKTEDSTWKIFRNVSAKKILPPQSDPQSPLSTFNTRPWALNMVAQAKFPSPLQPDRVFFRYLSEKYSPAGVFIDSEYNILFVVGDVRNRLSIREGVFHTDLLQMVDSDLASIIRTGVLRLSKSEKDVMIKGVIKDSSGSIVSLDISFSRVQEESLGNMYFISFGRDEVISRTEMAINLEPASAQAESRIRELEERVKTGREELQKAVEELETSNEELQSSNEELMAANEELQSTNEELQSVNEELYTVNMEVQEKNRELSRVNNDINNFINSTEVGALFLDMDLNIRRFTPALQRHFKLVDDDIGRSILSFASNFRDSVRNVIVDESRKAITKLSSVEHEVTDTDGSVHLLRIGPFVTSTKQIEGAVLTFVDISHLSWTQNELHLLKQIPETITPEKPLEQGLKDVSRLLARSLGVPYCTIYTASKQTGDLSIAASNIGASWRKLLGSHVKLLEVGRKVPTTRANRLYRVLKRRKPERMGTFGNALKDLTDSPDLKIELVQSTNKRSLPGVVRLPLIEDDQALGILELAQPVRLLGDNAEALERIASQLMNSIQRSQAVSALVTYNSRFATIVETTPAPILIARVSDGLIRFSNSAFLKLIGAPDKGETPLNLWDLSWEGEDRKRLRTLLAQAGGFREEEFEWKCQSGDAPNAELWVQVSCDSITYLGESCVFLGFQDVTSRILYSRELQRQVSERTAALDQALLDSETARRELGAILNSAMDGIVVTDNSGKIRLVNRAFCSLFELQGQEVVGMSLKDLSKHAGAEVDMGDVRSDKVSCIKCELPDGNGGMKTFSCVKSPIHDSGDRKTGMVAVMRDITGQEEVDRLKNEFMSTAAHQLRTPLTSIKGFSELLLERRNLNDEQRDRFVKIINDQAESLAHIVSDLLDISRIESGVQLALVNEPVVFGAFVMKVVEALQASIPSHKVVVKLEKPDAIVFVDRQRMKQALENLIENAAKYSPDNKKVEVRCRVNREVFHLDVVDKGIGMTPVQVERAFDRFWRADTSNSGIPGSGLGLDISRSIISEHGGTLTLQSELGKGTTVEVRLPLFK